MNKSIVLGICYGVILCAAIYVVTIFWAGVMGFIGLMVLCVGLAAAFEHFCPPEDSDLFGFLRKDGEGEDNAE